ncbi:MAG: hypothetical protein NTY04_04525 [Candidatus Staskawiczbacteria bacterium]|nr:hypothetical protein [Candidatus Staskawiczbacteria bacterium]
MNIHEAAKFSLAYNPPVPIRRDAWDDPTKCLKLDSAKKNFIVYKRNIPVSQYTADVPDLLGLDWQLVV